MRSLHLCGAVYLCVILCLDITEGDTTESSGIFNRAKSKVKDLISNIRKPDRDRDPPPPAPPPPTVTRGTGGSLKEKIKKVRKAWNIPLLTNFNLS